MISIVISSVNPTYLNDLSINIRETIGVPYEILSFDNRDGSSGICEVYNKGIAQAKFDIICFIHEDIIIHTQNWGRVLAEIFSDPKVGLVGLAGSTYKSLAPTGYYFTGNDQLDLNYCNVKQRYKYTDRQDGHDYFNPTNELDVHAACVDGVWLCASKSALDLYKFDDDLLRGFHGYDLDLSLGINQSFKVLVTFRILITHFSEGNFDRKWFEEILKVHQKWAGALPLNLAGINEKEVLNIEKRVFRYSFIRMKNWGFSLFDLSKVVYFAGRSRICSIGFSFKLYFSVLKYFFRRD